MSRFSLLTMLVALLWLGGGCVSQADLLEVQSRAQALRSELQSDIKALNRVIQSLPPDDPARADAMASLQELQTLDAAMASTITRIQAVLNEADSPSDPLTQLVGWLAPWLPEPARTPALLGSALLVSVVRGQRLKAGFRSVVQGFDRALKDDPAFSEGFQRNAPTFRATQTAFAQRLVDSMSRRS